MEQHGGGEDTLRISGVRQHVQQAVQSALLQQLPSVDLHLRLRHEFWGKRQRTPVWQVVVAFFSPARILGEDFIVHYLFFTLLLLFYLILFFYFIF